MPVELRDWQQTFLTAWYQRCHGSAIVATGGGKSYAAVAAIISLKLPAIIFVPTLVLADQWRNVLATAGIRASLYSGEEKEIGWVTVALYQSLYRNPTLVEQIPVHVYDESDQATADQWRQLLEVSRNVPYVMMLTATPPTEPDRVRIMSEVAPILFRLSTSQAISQGLLVQPTVVPYPVELNAVEREGYDTASDNIMKAMRALGTGNPAEIGHIIRSGSYDSRRWAGAYFKNIQERKRILAESAEKNEAVLRIIHEHPHEKILIFGTRIEPLSDLGSFLDRNGIPSRIITGTTGKKARREILEQWGVTFGPLISAKVLERGVDVPSATIAIFIGGGAGEREVTQRLGRVLRTAPFKTGAHVYVVFDTNTIEDKLKNAIERVAAGDFGEE